MLVVIFIFSGRSRHTICALVTGVQSCALPISSPTFAIMMSPPVPRFASRSTAFERHLRKAIFGDRRVTEVKRPNLAVVLNATELRTGTAFRFGSKESGSWRYGRLVKTPTV